MFEKILNELKTKYKHLGLSEKILKVWAKKLSLTVKEETEIENAVKSVEADLEIIQSLTDQNRTLANQLKEIQEGKVQVTREEKENDSDKETEKEDVNTTPEWAKALISSNEKLIEEVNTLKGEKAKEVSKKRFQEKAKEMGIHEKFYKTHESREFKSDDSMDEFLNILKTDQDEFKKSIGVEKLENHASPIFGKTDEKSGVSADMQTFLETEKAKNEKNN